MIKPCSIKEVTIIISFEALPFGDGSTNEITCAASLSSGGGDDDIDFVFPFKSTLIGISVILKELVLRAALTAKTWLRFEP